MRFFISQPMAGLSDADILKKRNEIIGVLKEKFGDDIEIIDSFTKSETIVDRGRVAMLGHSIMMMWNADVVIFCDGWSQSSGCMIEHQVCTKYDISRIYESELMLSDTSEDVVFWR